MRQQSIPNFFWAITIELPATNPDTGAAIMIEGKPVYETNYFCRLVFVGDKDKRKAFNEWDTDERYARRFVSEQMATNYYKVVLKSLAGCIIKQIIPNQISKPVKKVNNEHLRSSNNSPQG